MAYCKYPVNICGLNSQLGCAPLHVGHTHHGSWHLAQARCLWKERPRALFLKGFDLKLARSFPVTSRGFVTPDSFCEGTAGAGCLFLLAPPQLSFETKQPLINVLGFSSGPSLFQSGRAHASPAHCCFLRFPCTTDACWTVNESLLTEGARYC